MGMLDGQVAFVTGAARGMGRSHAVRLADEGADIIAVDICRDIPSVAEYYHLASEDDLAETARLVAKTGRRIVARRADVRALAALSTAFEAGRSELGDVSVIVANAGIWIPAGTAWEL